MMDDRLMLILVYECEDLTLYPIGFSQSDPVLAFADAYDEAWSRDLAAARALCSDF